MRQGLVKLFFERLVPLLEFRKMRLDGHEACLLFAELPDKELYIRSRSDATRVWVVHRSNPRFH
jgi:hypothetical protein